MIKSDQMVMVIIVALLIIHTTVWAVGYFTHKLSYLFSFVNAAAAMLLLATGH